MRNKTIFVVLAVLYSVVVNNNLMASAPAPEHATPTERQRPRFNFSGVNSAFKTSEPNSPEVRAQISPASKATTPKSMKKLDLVVQEVPLAVFQPLALMSPPSTSFSENQSTLLSPSLPSAINTPYSSSRELSYSSFAQSESMMSPSFSSCNAVISRSASIMNIPESNAADAAVSLPATPAVLPLTPVQELKPVAIMPKTYIEYFLHFQRSPDLTQEQWQQVVPDIIKNLKSFKDALLQPIPTKAIDVSQPLSASAIINTFFHENRSVKYRAVKQLSQRKDIQSMGSLHLLGDNPDKPIDSLFTHNFGSLDMSRDAVSFGMKVHDAPDQLPVGTCRLFVENKLGTTGGPHAQMTKILDATFKANQQGLVACTATIERFDRATQKSQEL